LYPLEFCTGTSRIERFFNYSFSIWKTSTIFFITLVQENQLENNLPPQNEFWKLLINVKTNWKFHYFQFSPNKHLFAKHEKWKGCLFVPMINILSHLFRFNISIQNFLVAQKNDECTKTESKEKIFCIIIISYLNFK
jgi:hypothetical protein